MTYTRLTIGECRRCATPVLRGMVGGLAVRLDTLTVPVAHARLLDHYGVVVFLTEIRRFTGIWADAYDSYLHRALKANQHLTIAHTCGVARRRRTP